MNSVSPPSIPTASDLQAAVAGCAAQTGHFDELRHNPTVWQAFFHPLQGESPHDLNKRAAKLQRQIDDNSISYNVYADRDDQQRPWSVDLFPFIVENDSWRQLETGIQQRVRLLEAIMADVYGPQQLLHQGLLPAALVHGHPGYLRPLHGTPAVGGTFLHVAAFDVARGPDGRWWLIAQRFQAPSGLGYLLENRLAVERQFPHAFASLRVQRLAASYRALVDSLKAHSPAGADAHIALLTPGPYSETYFEHAYLAHYLGLSLVEGNDLLVRDEHLYLKTLRGLLPVHGLLKCLDDQFLDPVELRPDSSLGVPGLLQAIRAGHVLVANAPGAAFLESPALLGFLPAIARHVLHEELQLPALPTWWCGEHSAMQEALPRLHEHTIKASYPHSPVHASFTSVRGHNLSPAELHAWQQRITQHGDPYTVQAYLPFSQIPVWRDQRMQTRSAVLRLFAISDPTQAPDSPRRWRIVPGALTRIHDRPHPSSADTWIITDQAIDTSALLHDRLTPALLTQRQRMVTSRAAENLYWLGRYTERADNAVRLAQLVLQRLHADDAPSPPLLAWLNALALRNTLVLPGTAAADDPAFTQALIRNLGSTQGATSVGFYVRALKMAAATVRARLSQEHWNVIARAEECMTLHAQHANWHNLDATLSCLHTTSDCLASITGAQTDRMMRDDGWRLLTIGRHVERLIFLASSLELGFQHHSIATEDGFDAMLDLFDNTIIFRAQYQQNRDAVALIDLLVLDRDNPKSLAWVAHTLRGRLAKLAGEAPGALGQLSRRIPDPGEWQLSTLADDTLAQPHPLRALMRSIEQAAMAVSSDISAAYFTHAGTNQPNVTT